jgi:HEAT repeat protein
VSPPKRTEKKKTEEEQPDPSATQAAARERLRLLVRLVLAALAVAIVACVVVLAGVRGRTIDRLVAELGDPNLATRRRAAQAIAEQQEPDDRLRNALVENIGDPDQEIRRWCARGLGALGSLADVPLLESRLQDEKTPVRRAAAFSLLKLDPQNAASQKELTAAMRTGDGGVILALTSWEPPPAWAAPTLVMLLKDRRPGIRRLAADALGHTGQSSAEAKAALRNASKDPDDRVREAVTGAIARLKE